MLAIHLINRKQNAEEANAARLPLLAERVYSHLIVFERAKGPILAEECLRQEINEPCLLAVTVLLTRITFSFLEYGKTRCAQRFVHRFAHRFAISGWRSKVAVSPYRESSLGDVQQWRAAMYRLQIGSPLTSTKNAVFLEPCASPSSFACRVIINNLPRAPC